MTEHEAGMVSERTSERAAEPAIPLCGEAGSKSSWHPEAPMSLPRARRSGNYASAAECHYHWTHAAPPGSP